MTRDVRIVDPDETLEEAALAMAETDVGIMPVGRNDRLVGMITDRDIAIRGVAQRRGSDTKVSDVMSPEIRYCFVDDNASDVLDNLAEIQVRRLPVLNRDKRLVGIVSISDLADSGEAMHVGEALSEIARPSTRHSQIA
jgi:CBS domain-containing protein